MILLLLNCVMAVPLGMMLLKANLVNKRGTNAVTRFIRDTGANFVYSRVMTLGIISGLGCCILGAIFKAPYAGIPTLLIAAASYALSHKSANNKQRIKDARTVTKGSLKVVGQSSEVAAVAATAYFSGGNPAAMKLAKTAGSAIGSISDSCADSMDDVTVPDLSVQEVLNEVNPEDLIAFARKSGLQVEGRELSGIASDVVTYMPDVYKTKYPSLDPVQLAIKVAKGGS